uniref:OTU domain-containing protein n=1 Tax=Panagrolaimus davidi TaxID=227884 RepID=A0A914QW11_9BILA
MENDGLDIIPANETKKTIFPAPEFISPTLEQIQHALKITNFLNTHIFVLMNCTSSYTYALKLRLKILGIDEKNAMNSPLLKSANGKLNMKKLKLRDVKPDGNCGYRVLSYLLTGTENFHWIIRLKVMDHVAKNGDKILGISDVVTKQEFQTKFQNLSGRRPGPVGEYYYAGNNDFCGFASWVNIDVFVNSKNTERWAPHIKDEGRNETDPALYIHHINQNHFMAIDGI